ncbi:hypothetical protein ACIGHN_02165 [Acidovorax sp. NPDC077693]|uniref:hypothetical protein n=1 Tax=unclassified Acidovorax TaxID=2684926 RepID=UPI0037C92DBE
MQHIDSEKNAAVGAQFVAMAAVDRWEKIVDVLTPILGRRGVAALYRRTLDVAGCRHPCLLYAHESDEHTSFEPLRRLLEQQSADAATAASEASLQTLHELLDSLIGTNLTQRLLGSLSFPLVSSSHAQDTKT